MYHADRKSTSKSFWAETVNTSCYILNKVMVRPTLMKTSYELLKGKKPYIAYFKVFGSKVFIHNNDKKDLDKFEKKSNISVVLGYFEQSKAYRVFNNDSKTMEETPHVIFDEFYDNTNDFNQCRK